MIRLRIACPLVLTLSLLGAGCASSIEAEPTPVAGVSDLPVTRAGEVYFSGQPSLPALADLRAQGVRHVVSLRDPGEREGFDEASEASWLGMEFTRIPVTPEAVGQAELDAFARAIEGSSGPVLVHCGTSNRAGMMWAAYLARDRGVPLPRALELGRAAGMKPALEPVVERLATGG